jgi:AcrR family transcriptional regulator
MPPRLVASNVPIRRRDRSRTKQRIIEVAKDLFAAQGYAHAGLREIAAQAGCSPNTLARKRISSRPR